MMNRLKSIIVSFFSIFLLCSVVTALPLLQETPSYKISNERHGNLVFDETINQLYEILDFLADNVLEYQYKMMMFALMQAQKEYLPPSLCNTDTFNVEAYVSQIKSFDENIQKAISVLIEELSLCINPVDDNRSNTDAYRLFHAVHIAQKCYMRGQDLTSWWRVSVPQFRVIMAMAFLLFHTLYKVEIFPIEVYFFLATLSIVTTPLYQLLGFWFAWYLSINGVDITFIIYNNTGVPLDGLCVTATPWHGIYEKGIFEYSPFVFGGHDGWYHIPLRHIDELDVPPGIFDFTISGAVDEKEYFLSFDNSDEPLPMGGKLNRVIELTPL